MVSPPLFIGSSSCSWARPCRRRYGRKTFLHDPIFFRMLVTLLIVKGYEYTETDMNHFPDEACLDFVRRVMPQNRELLMQRHLDDGCEGCLRLCQLWSAVVSIIGRESEY